MYNYMCIGFTQITQCGGGGLVSIERIYGLND